MSRKTIQKNLAYDTERKLYYVTLYESPAPGQPAVRRVRTFPVYKDAVAALYLQQPAKSVKPSQEPRPKLKLPAKSCSLGEWLGWWLEEEVERTRAASTAYGYRNMIRGHILPAIGELSLEGLTSINLQTYLYSKENEGLCSNTVLKHFTLLKTALRRAVKLKLLTVNPMDEVTPPLKTKTRYTFYSPLQLRTLFEIVEGKPIELAVKLAAYLGLRRSEIAGLRWQCVDLQAGIITIEEVRTEVGGREVVKSPKTETSSRKLGISGLHDLYQVLMRAWTNRRSDDPQEYVVLKSDGTRPLPDSLTTAMREVVRENNLPKITLHGLRHSFASVANRQGATMHDISQTLGHSSIAVTSKIYTHMFDETKCHTIQVVAAAIEPSEKALPIATPPPPTQALIGQGIGF